MAVYQKPVSLASEIKEKRNILRERYGGLMTLENVRAELGYKSRSAARDAVRELDLPATQIGRLRKYDTDVVARRLVERRGMC